jgi:hypothetical protein
MWRETAPQRIQLRTALGQGDRDVGAQGVFLSGYQRVEQDVLRVEILVDRAEGQTCFYSNIGNRRSMKTIAGEHFLCRHHDLVTRLLLVTDRGGPSRVGVICHRPTTSSKHRGVALISTVTVRAARFTVRLIRRDARRYR